MEIGVIITGRTWLRYERQERPREGFGGSMCMPRCHKMMNDVYIFSSDGLVSYTIIGQFPELF